MAVVAHDGTALAVDLDALDQLSRGAALRWLAGALGGHFAPYVHLALLTAVVAILGMFAITTTRSDTAFSNARSLQGTFLNRGFHADYTLDALRTTSLFVATWDPEHGATVGLRQIPGSALFSPVSREVMGAVGGDAGHAGDVALRSVLGGDEPGAGLTGPGSSPAVAGPADEDDEHDMTDNATVETEPEGAGASGNQRPAESVPTRPPGAIATPVRNLIPQSASPSPRPAPTAPPSATTTPGVREPAAPPTPVTTAGPQTTAAPPPPPAGTSAPREATPPITNSSPSSPTPQTRPTPPVSIASPVPSTPTPRPTATRRPVLPPTPWVPSVPTLVIPKMPTSQPLVVPAATATAGLTVTLPTVTPTLLPTILPTLTSTFLPTSLPTVLPPSPTMTPTAVPPSPTTAPSLTSLPTATHTPPPTATSTLATATLTPTETATVAAATATPTVATATATPTPTATTTTTALQRTQNLISALQAVAANHATSNPPVSAKLNDAEADAQSAANALSTAPPNEAAAAGYLEWAVNDIQNAVDMSPGLDPAQGWTLMDEAASIARQLATEAIDAAIARGGNPTAIADAEARRSEGDTERAANNFQAATNKYKNALTTAQSA